MDEKQKYELTKKFIKELCTKKNMTMQRLAERLSIPQAPFNNFISGFESYKSNSNETNAAILQRICLFAINEDIKKGYLPEKYRYCMLTECREIIIAANGVLSCDNQASCRMLKETIKDINKLNKTLN